MVRVVLDTNIWLSGIFWKGNSYRIIKLGEAGKIDIITTRDILLEIIRVLKREAKFQKFLNDRDLKIENLLKTIFHITIFIKSESSLNIITKDPDDDKILEAAVDGKADYIVTYDSHLLNLKDFREIKIIKPKRFLDTIPGV